MRSLQRKASILAAVTGFLGLALAACNNSEAPSTPVLTRAQADSVGQVLSADLDALSQGATYSGTSDIPFAVAVPLSAPAPRAVQTCRPSRSPSPAANSDGDPVPDSVRLDFSGCVISDPTETITISGTIDIIDPTPSTTDRAVRSVFTDFTRSRTDLISNKTTSVKENGTRSVSASSSVLQHSQTDFRTDYTFADGSTASHVKTWSSTFTADVAGTIKPDSLPNGTWNVTGTSTWTRGSNTYSLSVTTNPQLHYNATCALAPRFDSGTLIAVVTKGSASSTVTIQFTACGQYTVTRS